MKLYKTYSVSFSGLSDGFHHFEFTLNPQFLAEFPESPVKETQSRVRVELEKRIGMLSFSFHLDGTVRVPCDLCNEPFDLVLDHEETLLVKLVAELPETEVHDAEVMYLLNSAHALNLADTFYEMLILAIPMRHVHPDNEQGLPSCNPEILRYISGYSQEDTSPEQPDETSESSSIWTALKNLKNQ